jgi:hypothetical protein
MRHLAIGEAMIARRIATFWSDIFAAKRGRRPVAPAVGRYLFQSADICSR